MEHGRQKTCYKVKAAVLYVKHSRPEGSSVQECSSAICEHGRRRSMHKECGGSAICEHSRQRRSDAKRCERQEGAICEHGRPRLATGVRAGVLFVSMAGLKAQSQGTWQCYM
jgi:hypothetical protein